MSRTASQIAAAILGALYGGAAAAAWKMSDAVSPMDSRGLYATAAVYAVLGVGWFSIAFLRPMWNKSWLLLAVAALTAVEICWGWMKDESSPTHALETLIILSLVGVVVTSRLAR